MALCVCMCVFWCSALVCMSLLQAAFNSASATSPCPLEAASCSAVHPSCRDGGVSRQSGARMLHCCPYRESNTQIEEGGKNPRASTHTHTLTHNTPRQKTRQTQKQLHHFKSLDYIPTLPLKASYTSSLRPQTRVP